MNDKIPSGTVETILEILGMLPGNMILSDGGTDWSVECLIDAIQEGNESDPDTVDNREYVVGFTSDGRLTISKLTEVGLVTPPTYTQKAED